MTLLWHVNREQRRNCPNLHINLSFKKAAAYITYITWQFVSSSIIFQVEMRTKISACNVGHRRKCVQLLCPGDPRHQGQVQDIGRDLLPRRKQWENMIFQWENNVKLHTLMAWKRFWIDFYDCNHPFGELWRHICQTCFLFYPATSLAYVYAVVWSHFEGNLTKWHVIPIQNTTASMFLKGQLCRINFGLSQGSQKLFCAIHVPEAD